MALTIGLLGTALVWVITRDEKRVCTHLLVEITDYDQRQYLEADDVRRLLIREGLFVQGSPIDDVHCDAIEGRVASINVVRTAQCYKTAAGDVRIVLTQREPLLRVITDHDVYFVDTDHKRLEDIESIRTPVIRISGSVRETTARGPIAEMVEWLQHDTFWKDRINRIEIQPNQHIILHQKGKSPALLLGEMNRYKSKLKRLQTFLAKVEPMGLPAYKELDARYDGQVIGRR